jgi:hypothetical protein
MGRLCKEADKPFIAALRSVASSVPATIVLDGAATAKFGAVSVWREFRIVPSGSAPIECLPSIVVPKRMTPEMISEFPVGQDAGRILEVIRERAAGSACAVTFFLYDFVTSVLKMAREEPEPLQLFEGYCRFRYPMDIRDLGDDMTTQERILALLVDMKRNG